MLSLHRMGTDALVLPFETPKLIFFGPCLIFPFFRSQFAWQVKKSV